MREGKLGLIGVCAALLLGVGVLSAVPASAGGPPLKGSFGERMELRKSPQSTPDVAFKTREGERVTLADFEGEVLVLNFWATWCAPCVEEMPTLEALHTDMRDAGVHVLAVSQDRGGMDAVGPFLKNRVDVPELPIYLDSDGKLARAFDVRAMPTTFVLDAEGRVIGNVTGPLDWNSDNVQAFLRHYADKAEGNGG
ncbi:Thiol-disulfide isomerase or thioredoxin [Limimonas halophila]|uniref:Thiol-disulfide isomerase or thioredoxin n=1 Tax=Limimonas halophila TaxID=1082479 RepID=A0A1G7UH65_9PROT|nr:TlpA disulfide reductase family protein [Limimonas halophila]SDG46834.1 Thiol-disulfide isomerase or thioredoxin [Limimonas halophila]